MAFIKWTEANNVGINEVDEQHRKLFEMLNSLHQATVNGQERAALATILDDLIDYTVYHFQVEERLFLEHSYPDYEEHKKEHDKLTAQAVELQRQFHQGSATISFEVLDFLNSWLMDHTMGQDKAMGPFMNERGVR